ncbi:MAG: M14 family metallopeptidase [Henriciella sp.]
MAWGEVKTKLGDVPEVMDEAILSCFSASYSEARQKFLQACQERSLTVDSRLNPNAQGVGGEALYTDIVQIGSQNAAKVLLLMSATHGVEGYCGSGAQIALLKHGYFDNLPDDLSVVLIHAMNPYGFSHDRRVTEDNVDLNRNFMDFERADLPGKDYARIHEFVLPADWDGPEREYADTQLAEFIQEHGMQAFQAAVSSGQYQHPDGVFYGGSAPTWSNRMFKSVLSDYISSKKIVGIMDFHTGLGPHGYGELITVGSEAQKTRAVNWYGDQVTDPEAGTSSSAPLDGMVSHGITETLTEAQITFITLEFGTYPIERVLNAVRADNWLYQRGAFDNDLAANIKKDIKQTFYPDTDVWKMSVWSRSLEVFEMAVSGVLRS